MKPLWRKHEILLAADVKASIQAAKSPSLLAAFFLCPPHLRQFFFEQHLFQEGDGL